MSDMNIWKIYDDSELNGYTLIIPSVAVGNVGQLACDLLISSLKMKKIASIFTFAQIPVIGYDPYDLDSNNISGSCEVYKSDSENLVVIQMRAPLIYNKARKCLENIIEWTTIKHIKSVIVLTSSFAQEKKNILSSAFRFITSSTLYENSLKETDILQHEVLDGDIKIFGGGFAGLIYKICEENSVPCLILFKYASEGDNIPDAYEMVKYLNSVHSIFKSKDVLSQLIQPVSWKLLFGAPPPLDIY